MKSAILILALVAHILHSPYNAIAAPQNPRPLVRSKFTGEKCKYVDDDGYIIDARCVPPRLCMDLGTNPIDVCSKLSETCFCRPRAEEDLACSCDTPCPINEKCVMVPDSSEPQCRSSSLPGIALDCPNSTTDLGRLNYENCKSQKDCAAGRSCVFHATGGYIPCDGHDECMCLTDDMDDRHCSCKYPECPAGEVCTINDDYPICRSIALNEQILSCENRATPSPVSESGTIFTGGYCLKDSDCVGDRRCTKLEEDPTCSQGYCYCYALELEDKYCSCLNPECTEGDRCSYFYGATCQSVNLDVQPLRCDDERVVAEDDATGEGKFTKELCVKQNECAGNRRCVDDDNKDCKGLETLCRCMPDERHRGCSCEERACLKGDVCAFDRTDAMCYDKTLNPHPITCNGSVLSFETPEPSAETAEDSEDVNLDGETLDLGATPVPVNDACVDAEALSGLKREELLYAEHMTARVLCDSFGSCATPGHMVEYVGSWMMMKKYCEVVGCVEKVREVNSPRYRRGLRVASKSEGLHFTAFAARYGTRAEEAIMATALRIGL